ncbi:MAG: ABC transporter permease [Bacteroidota bacterium]
MFDLDKWQEIFLTIRKNKLRAALTAFGVFWGIFMLVILLGAGSGLENGVTSSFDITKNAVFVWSQRTSVPYKGLQPGRFIQLTNDDAYAIRNNVPDVDILSARIRLTGNFSITREENNANFTVYGDYPQFLKVKPLIIESGRFLNDLDMENKRKVAVIGSRVKEVLFPDGENPVGKAIKIKGIHFKVIGVFNSKVKGQEGIEDVQTLYIPLTTLQVAFNRPNQIGWFSLIPKNGVRSAKIEKEVKTLLAERHTVAPNDLRAFGSANVEREYQEIQTLFTGIRGFSWLVAIGTIFSGMVGVANIMMIIVKERTREIGVRKAMGATPFSIISMILQESLFLTALAGFIGLGCGIIVVEGINYLTTNFGLESEFFANPEIDPSTIASALIVILLAGLMAGFFPGKRAARVNPVIALRAE